MSANESSATLLMSAQNFFDQTGWSTIREAQCYDPKIREEARERLLTRYRRPILKEISQTAERALGDPEDLTQQFLHEALKRDFLMGAHPSRGRFRAWVKACIANFLNDQRDRMMAIKRGEGKRPGSLDETNEEGDRLYDPPDPKVPVPGAGLDREWALEVFTLALSALEAKFVSRKRGPIYQALKPWLAGDPANGQYAAVAASTGIKEGTLRVTVERMRNDLHELIKREVKQTVSDTESWEDEVHYLMELL